MDLRATEGVASRFAEYVEHLSEVIGHVDRHGPLASYCTGLLLPGDRKSIEPMAARIAPDEVGSKHQSLHHFVAKAPWDEAGLLSAVRTFVLPKIEKGAPIRAWIIDDTGIPKKGKHSAPILRRAWQTGQLPGRGDAFGRKRSRQPADCVATLSPRAVD